MKKIMVVDDERMIEEMMERTLAKSGYEHVSFEDPVKALTYFRAT